MKRIYFFLFWAFLSSTTLAAADPNRPSNDSFEQIAVERILNIDEYGTLYCDLAGLPPIVGKNMPVQIKDLKPASSAEANQKIQAFLVALFSGDAPSRQLIQLHNIGRGQTFCLCADIRCDGKDVAQMLVDKGLAERVLKVKEPPQPAAAPSPQAAPIQNGYVASKTSKVFHRADCYHVRRMDAAKAVQFQTREEALKTGRRPCKTCNP